MYKAPNESQPNLIDHDDFVHMVAHELKTPVSVLKAYIQLIQLKFNLQHEPVTILEKMDIQLDKILNLLSDLSDVANINSGLLNCLMNDFSINHCIIDCVDGFRAMYPTFYMEYELDGHNPIVNGDKERIDQVITNLIGNAIKYSLDKKYIKISSKISGEYIVVKITDKGIGIPAESQQYIFERFYRVNLGTVPKTPGLGLGLFISAEIIKKHKGQVGLESKEGVGSTFWFSIPCKALR